MGLRGHIAAAIAASVIAVGCSGSVDGQEARGWVEQTYGGSEWTELSPGGWGELDRVYGARADGDCVAVEISTVGRDLHDTVFVRQVDGRWVVQDLVTGPDALEWVDGAGEYCYTDPLD